MGRPKCGAQCRVYSPGLPATRAPTLRTALTPALPPASEHPVPDPAGRDSKFVRPEDRPGGYFSSEASYVITGCQCEQQHTPLTLLSHSSRSLYSPMVSPCCWRLASSWCGCPGGGSNALSCSATHFTRNYLSHLNAFHPFTPYFPYFHSGISSAASLAAFSSGVAAAYTGASSPPGEEAGAMVSGQQVRVHRCWAKQKSSLRFHTSS